MSDADIDKAVKEAAEYEAQDKKRKEAIDARNDADSMVFQTEKALEEVGDKIDANDKAEVEADLNALKGSNQPCSGRSDDRCSGRGYQVRQGEADEQRLRSSLQRYMSRHSRQEQQVQALTWAAQQAAPDRMMM